MGHLVQIDPPPSPFLPCFWGQKTDFRFFLLLCHLPPFYGLSFWHHVKNISPNSQKKSYRRLSKTFRFWFVQDSLGENKITHWVLLDWISSLSPFYYRQQALSLSSSKEIFRRRDNAPAEGMRRSAKAPSSSPDCKRNTLRLWQNINYFSMFERARLYLWSV